MVSCYSSPESFDPTLLRNEEAKIFLNIYRNLNIILYLWVVVPILGHFCALLGVFSPKLLVRS